MQLGTQTRVNNENDWTSTRIAHLKADKKRNKQEVLQLEIIKIDNQEIKRNIQK